MEATRASTPRAVSIHVTLVVQLIVTSLGVASCAGAAGVDEFLLDADGRPADLASRDAGADLRGADLATGDAALPSGCDPMSTVLGPEGGPGSCAYGEVCDAMSLACVPVPVGACAMTTGAPAWNQSAKLAPVIARVSATFLATTTTTECLNGDPAALVSIDFYAPSFLTTTSDAAMFVQQVQFKKSTVSSNPYYDANFVRMLPVPNQRVGSFQVGINCGGAAGSSRTAGIYIVDEGGRTSNPVCVTW